MDKKPKYVAFVLGLPAFNRLNSVICNITQNLDQSSSVGILYGGHSLSKIRLLPSAWIKLASYWIPLLHVNIRVIEFLEEKWKIPQNNFRKAENETRN